jgi:hypothetical protein
VNSVCALRDNNSVVRVGPCGGIKYALIIACDVAIKDAH